jgi:REP element-mobilizing transposase RayT
MPRMGRIVLPEYPHHVVQRGHDRNVVFTEASDFRYYLDTLVEFKDVYGVQVYAYCLMANHVHLLLAPSDYRGLGQLMKRLAGRQTRYRNRLERRSGTLLEGRYKSSLAATRRPWMPSSKASGGRRPRRYPGAERDAGLSQTRPEITRWQLGRFLRAPSPH